MADEKLQREENPQKEEEKKNQLPQNEKEEEDLHPEVESDENEHHDEFASDSEEMPDYEHMSDKDLVAAAKHLLQEKEIPQIKNHMESIKALLNKHFHDLHNEKLQEFIENGGVEIDFEFIQPLQEEFRKISNDYRQKRNKYYKDLEESLNRNLAIKQDLVKTLKDLPNHEGSVNEAYNLFKDIIDRWKKTGPVPKAESDNLWRTYHHHVDNFYDYLKLSQGLRELDFKKNQTAKESLCEEAEKLAQLEVDQETFNELQKLHKRWKEIGPVAHEIKEELWQRFSAATKTIHEKRHEFYGELREKRGEMVEKKKALVEKLRNLIDAQPKNHSGWQKAIKQADQIREEFKKIGRVIHPDNDKVWDLYREVNQFFNRSKNAFYKELKAQQGRNLEMKKSLLKIAEDLKDSDDFKNATREFKRIQSEWKKIGYVPKSESDKIWDQFRTACNHYFDRLSNLNKEKDKKFAANVSVKEALLKEVEAFSPTEEYQKDIETLKGYISQWKSIGPVPRDKREIDNDFNKLMDQKFDALHLDKSESTLIRFENKIDLLVGADDMRRVYQERDMVKKKMDEFKKELIQLENNINFFSSASDDNPLLKEAKRNIKKHQDNINMLKEKLKIIRTTVDKANNQPKETEAPSEELKNDE